MHLEWTSHRTLSILSGYSVMKSSIGQKHLIFKQQKFHHALKTLQNYATFFRTSHQFVLKYALELLQTWKYFESSTWYSNLAFLIGTLVSSTFSINPAPHTNFIFAPASLLYQSTNPNYTTSQSNPILKSTSFISSDTASEPRSHSYPTRTTHWCSTHQQIPSSSVQLQN